MIKLTVVATSGITAFLHARATTRRGMAVFGALTGLTALAAPSCWGSSSPGRGGPHADPTIERGEGRTGHVGDPRCCWSSPAVTSPAAAPPR